MKNKTILDIFSDMSREGVPLIVWKNINEIEAGLAGLEDIDLLVPLEELNHFMNKATAEGFVEASHRVLVYPGVRHFYWYDTVLRKIIHLHVFSKLITGESHIKNYHFPYEQTCLKAYIQISNGLSLPSSRVLADIFLLRYYIKVSCLPGWLLLYRKRATLTQEWECIKKEGETEGDWQEDIGLEASFRKVLHDSFDGPKGSFKHIALGICLRLKIQHLSRFSHLGSLVRRSGQIIYRLANKILFKHKKIPVRGGAFISIVGADGMGKTTLIGKTHEWLNTVFETNKVHLGLPPPSLVTLPCRIPLFFIRKMLEKRGDSLKLKKRNDNSVSIWRALHYWMLAYERYKLGCRIQRQINRGLIVFSDRYPSKTRGAMDSPRIGVDIKSPLIRLIGRSERNLYSRIPKPSLLIRLNAPEEILLSRNKKRNKKNKETDSEIRDRYWEYNRMEYVECKTVFVDVSGELEDTIEILKKIIWSNI